jgi:hypothetical protein
MGALGRSVTAAAVIASVTGCSRGLANPTGKSAQGEFASGSASGDYAVAQTSGTVYSPSGLRLRLVASPAQSALVTWTLTCNESGGGVGQKSRQSTLEIPAIETLSQAATSERCIVAANAQLNQSGTLNISLHNGAAPAVSASPTTTPTSTPAVGPSASTTATTAADTARGSVHCGAPPYGQGPIDDRDVNVGPVTAQGISCSAAFTAIAAGHLNPEFHMAGFSCLPINQSQPSSGETNGQQIRCVGPSGQFTWSWAT